MFHLQLVVILITLLLYHFAVTEWDGCRTFSLRDYRIYDPMCRLSHNWSYNCSGCDYSVLSDRDVL